MITKYDKEGRPVICLQPGPQEMFGACTADIVIYGGAAYGGKSVALILEASRNVTDPRYTAVIFRRKYKEIIDGGGLWDTSHQVYPALSGEGTRGRTEWTFPAGCRIKFNHLNKESDIYDHQGAAYVFLGFDELTHFTKQQFFYLLTRNRPPAGCLLKPYCRATCNPDPDSWVGEFIAWWIDQDTGYPIPERSGVIRYFTRRDDDIIWVSPDWRDQYGNPPKSITFIASSIEDNPLGIIADPTYRANLLAQDKVTREQLLKGNWLINYTGGMFNPVWFEIVDHLPAGIKLVRYWDFAASEVKENDKDDPDWTAGALVGIHENTLYIADMNAFREAPGTTEKIIRQCAAMDGREVEVWWEEEKGSSGKFTSEYMKQIFKGYDAHPDPVSGSKVERARPWAAWAEFGRVKLLRGPWNKQFLARVGRFPEGKRDEVDAVSGGFKVLVGPKRVFQYYNPNDHLREFKRDKEDFEKVQPHNIEVYLALWADKEGGIYGGCYIWSLVAKRLRLYNEIFQPNPIAKVLAGEIIEKLVVPMEEKANFVTLKKIICNEEMLKPGKIHVVKELRQYGIRPHLVMNYDEPGAAFRINQLFADGRIVIHSDCIETDVQWRGWGYENKKMVDGFPLARNLCLIISQLRSEMKTEERKELKHYNKKRIELREKLYTQDKVPSIVTGEGKEHEWLTI